MQMAVEAVKLKLGTHCGTLASDMILHLKDGSGKLVAILAESHRKLGFFSPEDGWVLLFQRLCTSTQNAHWSFASGVLKVLSCAVQVGAACH